MTKLINGKILNKKPHNTFATDNVIKKLMMIRIKSAMSWVCLVFRGNTIFNDKLVQYEKDV